MKAVPQALHIEPLHWLVYGGLVALTLGLLASPWPMLSPVPALVLMAALLLGRRPQLGFLMIVFLIPFENLTGLSQRYEAFTLPKFIGAWTVFVVLLIILVKRTAHFSLRSNLWPWLLCFFVVSVISTLYTEWRPTALTNLRQLFVAFTILALTLVFATRARFARVIPALVVLGVLLNYLLFFLEYVLGLKIFWGPDPLFPKVEDRAGALPSGYSGILIFCVPLIVHFFFRATTLPRRLFWGACFLFSAAAVVYLRSRAGAVVFAAVFLLLLLEHKSRMKPLHLGMVVGVAAMFALAVLFLIPSSYWERQRGMTQTKTDASISRRITYLEAGRDIFLNHPVLGIGPGTFKEYYARTMYSYTQAQWDEGRVRQAHNTYLEVLTGTGLLGLLFFGGFVVRMLLNFTRARHEFLHRGELELASMAGAWRISLLSMLLMFLFLSHLYGKFLWVTAGLSQMALDLAEGRERSFTS